MRVPPARILFPPEDRLAILARIDEALTTGQLTLGPIGLELEDSVRGASRHAARGRGELRHGGTRDHPARRSASRAARSWFPRTPSSRRRPPRCTPARTLRFVDCDPQTMAIDPADLETLHRARHRRRRDRAHRRAHHARRSTRSSRSARPPAWSSWRTPRTRTAAPSTDARPVPSAAPASFSFYPTKVIAGGEGGMIVTDDDEIAEEARVYRDQGKGSFHANFHTRMGANWRMSEPHAAIVLSQLHRLDEFIERRQELAARYDAALASLDLGTLGDPGRRRAATSTSTSRSFPRASTARCSSSTCARSSTSDCRARSTTRRCTTSRSSRSSTTARCPGSEWLCARHVCLPLYPALSEADVDYVVESLATALDRDDLREVPAAIGGSREVETSAMTERCDDGRASPSPAAPASSAPTSSTRCSARATRCGCSTSGRRSRRRRSGSRSTCSTRTRSPTRSRAAGRCSTSRPWPT